MIYSKLTEIRDEIKLLKIFPDKFVILGEDFTLGANTMPFCVIKSGFGLIQSGHSFSTTAYIMALFETNGNLEQLIDQHMQTIVRRINRLPDVEVQAFTTDNDIFEPFGIVIQPVPPIGGFRLDVAIFKAI